MDREVRILREARSGDSYQCMQVGQSLAHPGQHAAANNRPQAQNGVYKDYDKNVYVQYHILPENLSIWMDWKERDEVGS